MRARIRSAIGPAMVAAAVWCALGDLTVATPEGATPRLAVPASLWWLLAAFAAAWAVTPWRKSPSLAAPALLTTMPWWPVPLPAIALLWTGGLAWVPIGLAVITAVAERQHPLGDPAGRAPAAPNRSAALAGLATLLVAVAVALSLAPKLPTGDEPHYLIITQSLLLDGDLRIGNNHDNRDYADYFNGTLRPDRIRDGKNGEVYSIHAPGTSLLVLPGFAMFGYRGAQATIVLFASVTGALIWLVAWLASGDRRAAWFGWAGVTLSTTFLVQAATIFPDGPAAFVTAATALILLTWARGTAPAARGVLAAGGLLATLPWLHSRFAVIAVGLGALVAWRVLAATTANHGARMRLLMTAFALPIASAVSWFGYFWVIYGTIDPSAPYGPSSGASVAYVPGGVLALLFDQQFGLIVYAPAIAAAAAGVALRSKSASARLVSGLAATAIAYAAAVATYWMWWGGVPATPARFITAALPLMAAPAAIGWHRSGPTGRAIWNLLLAATAAMTAIVLGTKRGTVAWNYRSSRTEWHDWLASSADLERGWPSFFWRLTPGDVSSEVPFALHVATWIAALAISGMLAAKVARLRAPIRPMRAAAWGLAVGLMLAVQCGWWLTGSRGIEASRPQISMLQRAGAGARLLRIDSFGWRSEPEPVTSFRIRARRADVDAATEPGWLPLAGLPAGRYQLWVENASSSRGTVIARSADAVLASFVVEPKALKSVRFDLPPGAGTLTLAPDASLLGALPVIELVPGGQGRAD